MARTALVVGGGVAGPATALALHRAGIDATVHEAYAAPSDGVGVTLSIAPNGLSALEIVGAADAVRAIGQPITRAVMHDGRGRTIGTFPGLRGLPPSLALWRDDLCRALRERAAGQGIETRFGERLVGAEEDPDGVTALFADGTTARADILVGADGIGSTVRTLIDPAAPGPQATRLLNFGAAADVTLPADPSTMFFAFGKRGFLGYWAQPDGRTAWFANVPHAAMTSAEARETPRAEWLDRLRDIYSDEIPAAKILTATDPEALTVLGSMQDMPKVPRWHRGRMVLVGDSAHAPSSSSGQGASMAVESAVELARCLRDIPAPEAAFTAYERLRRARVEKVIDRGAKANTTKTLGPFAKTMMRLTLPILTRTLLNPERTLGPEQRHTINWKAPAP
ncbi:FAD-dependent oxidoreductase [Actinomadura yumaensis]|uniref:FAD-dependent oxidoreductase n=1 Tax=Actinomadura yumaensis TaxID=111807 RepID=A0ABW2CN50_9ACTN